jgi:hypothetical protein
MVLIRRYPDTNADLSHQVVTSLSSEDENNVSLNTMAQHALENFGILEVKIIVEWR